MRIAVIGAGMGGLTAASLLSDQGHDITLFDQFDVPKPVGSGLVIQPVGQDILAQVGALETSLAFGNRVTHMLGHEAVSGRGVLDVRYDLVDPQAFGLAIHRSALFTALMTALQTRPRITLVTSAMVTSVRQDKDSVEVFTNTQDVYGPFEGVLPIGKLPTENNGQTKNKAAVFWSLPQNDHTTWRNTGLSAWKSEATEHHLNWAKGPTWPCLMPPLCRRPSNPGR